MSLEANIARLCELTETQNGLLTKLLGSASKTPAATSANDDGAATEGKTATTGAKRGPKAKADETKAAEPGDFTIDYADLKKKLSAWLAEFAKAEDKANPGGAHPEVAARKAGLKVCFGKLGVEKLDEIEKDAKKLAALNKWFEGKAKVDDHVGAGAGRFAADPEADEADEDATDDDIGDL